jgi:hypothetical protein
MAYPTPSVLAASVKARSSATCAVSYYLELPALGYEGGELLLDAPPNIAGFVDVTGGTIPLLCDAPECATLAGYHVYSLQTNYVVNHNDANAALREPDGLFAAFADIKTERRTATSTTNSRYPPETPACTPVRYCGDNIRPDRRRRDHAIRRDLPPATTGTPVVPTARSAATDT